MIALPAIIMLVLVAAVSVPALGILRKRWQRVVVAVFVASELAMAFGLAALALMVEAK